MYCFRYFSNPHLTRHHQGLGDKLERHGLKILWVFLNEPEQSPDLYTFGVNANMAEYMLPVKETKLEN